MNEQLQNKLFEKYPNQYKNVKHIDCEDGWYNIIDNCCLSIDYHIKTKNIDFFWSQQKSKFGGLRLYNYGADEFISGVVRASENMSHSICQFCGNKGIICHKGNWYETLCEKCKLENGYEDCNEVYKKKD